MLTCYFFFYSMPSFSNRSVVSLCQSAAELPYTHRGIFVKCNGQHQRVDIPARARIAHKDLLQKKTGRGSLLNRPSCPPDDPIGQGTEPKWMSYQSGQRSSRKPLLLLLLLLSLLLLLLLLVAFRWWWLFPSVRGFLENVRQFIPCLPPSPFFFKVEISSRTLIPLFRPGSVHTG